MIRLLPLLAAVALTACGMPVRVGIEQARAAGVVAQAEARGAPVPADQLVFIPEVPQPKEADDVVGVILQGSSTTPKVVTFGQVFIPGQLPRGASIHARSRGRGLPVQLDVKATNPDGSARMGVVTLVAPWPAEVMLVRGAPEIGPAVDLTSLAGRYELSVDMVVHGEAGDVPFHADAGALLSRALASGKVSYWLRGPLATEARVETPVMSSMRLVFDIRAYADGSTFTDVQFNNDIALQPVGGKLVYDVSIRSGGQQVFQQARVQHFQYQTWHKEIWSTGAPAVNVVHDVAAMARAGAIHNYDLSTGVSARLIAEARQQMAAPGFFDVLGNAGVTKYMGMTGGRADIGPVTMWNTLWLMTQHPDAARFALAQSDAAGSVPWHFFDAPAGTYLSVDKHPNFWADGRGRTSSQTSGFPAGQDVDNKGSGWSPDGSHQPELNYVPYLMTGSRYRLDQLLAQGAASISAMWPVPRRDAEGLVAQPANQVRGQAWDLRQIVEAAYIAPDNDPLKFYFRRMLSNNMAALMEQTRTAAQGEAHGWIKGTYGNGHSGMAPWQQDFLASTIVLAAEQGTPGAAEVLTWQTNFLAGRFLAGDRGFPPYDGVTYNMYTFAETQDSPFQTWREIYAATAEHGMSGKGTDWPPTFASYIQAAAGVLGGIVTVTRSSEALQAFDWLKKNDQSKAPKAGLLSDPTWNIVPVREQPARPDVLPIQPVH